MGKYLKEFENHSQYQAYTADTSNFILPNVSLCVNENEVHYNPIVPPQPIPIEGDIQIFANQDCTEYATGQPSKVYVRINNPWVGLDSGWSTPWLSSDGECIVCDSPNSDNPPHSLTTDYGFILWVDWGSDNNGNTPYEQGQIVEITGNYAWDVTNYTKVFSKPS